MLFQPTDCAVCQTGRTHWTDILIELNFRIVGRGISPLIHISCRKVHEYTGYFRRNSRKVLRSTADVSGTGVRPGICSSSMTPSQLSHAAAKDSLPGYGIAEKSNASAKFSSSSLPMPKVPPRISPSTLTVTKDCSLSAIISAFELSFVASSTVSPFFVV